LRRGNVVIFPSFATKTRNVSHVALVYAAGSRRMQ
jgi:hypothetical protein